MNKRIILLFLILPALLFAVKTKVKLLAGSSEQFRGKVEIVLTDVLNGLNRNHESGYPLKKVRAYFDDTGFSAFERVVKKTKIYAASKEYRSYLTSTANGNFEVRDLKMRVHAGATTGIPFQNLVFVLNKAGKIINLHFALERHHYKKIIKEGRELEDLAYREKILHFIELYRTAYNTKDFDFVKKTLSDDALIIVGHVIKTKKQETDYFQASYLSDEKIDFIRLNKSSYLKRLSKIFKKNDFVNILFDEIIIQRHPQFDKIYGVQLKQRWNSSKYSDQGYLFLMVDFLKPEEPIIHVRAWQPDKFEDGSTISIYDFEIVE